MNFYPIMFKKKKKTKIHFQKKITLNKWDINE